MGRPICRLGKEADEYLRFSRDIAVMGHCVKDNSTFGDDYRWRTGNVLYAEKQRMRRDSGCRRSAGMERSTPIEIPTAGNVSGGICVDI